MTAHATPSPAPVIGPGAQVVAALLRRGDDIVLVQEQRDGKEMWSVPGGGVERGELLTEALVREVLEETGLNLTAVGLLAYLVNTTTDRYPSTGRCHVGGGRDRLMTCQGVVGLGGDFESGRGGHGGGTGDLVPDREADGHLGAVVGGGHQVAAGPKVR
ncbi:NUDIX hydrolase [Streptomyces hirsutus]|uniref:NUDIX hydrolase n=1 Tax=Streptomyces hirsutus TaxID=35620 RepID=UPI0034034659